MIPPARGPLAFRVSQTSGNDANDGSSANPWKTIAKLNMQSFVPGDSIMLDAGDTWAETFLPQGTGVYPRALYESKYNTYRAANFTAHLSDGTYARFFTLATNAGNVADPNTFARGYCQAIANYEANEQALSETRVDASTQWITLGVHGVGAKPHINATGLQYGIKFPRGVSGTSLGWKISGLNVTGASYVGIAGEIDATGVPCGVWIDACDVTDCDGVVWAQGAPQFPGSPDSNLFCSTGLLFGGINNVCITGTNANRNGLGCMIYDCDACWVDGSQFNDNTRSGFYFSTRLHTLTYPVGHNGVDTAFVNGSVSSSQILRNGSSGMWFGTIAFEANMINGYWVRDNDIGLTLRPAGSPDGEGCDEEGGCRYGMIIRNHIHGCSGTVALNEASPGLGANLNTAFLDNVLEGNAVNPDQGITANAAWIRWDGQASNQIVFDGNEVILTSAGQKLIQGPGQHTLPTTNTPGSAWIMGTNNIHT